MFFWKSHSESCRLYKNRQCLGWALRRSQFANSCWDLSHCAVIHVALWVLRADVLAFLESQLKSRRYTGHLSVSASVCLSMLLVRICIFFSRIRRWWFWPGTIFPGPSLSYYHKQCLLLTSVASEALVCPGHDCYCVVQLISSSWVDPICFFPILCCVMISFWAC